jgi:hypothetical protein
MKNKARLSTMTAFSFGKRPVSHQSSPFKRASIMVFCLRFTSQNETSKTFLIPTMKPHLITRYRQPLTKGGIVLLRLLVAV